MQHKPFNIYIGFDARQPVSISVLAQSIYRQASRPVAIIPLVLEQLPLKRQGLTPFTFSRFLVPYLNDYDGWGLFMDADILVKCDIFELIDLADDSFSVMVSKNRHRFEWASIMLFNCAKCKILTPDYVETAPGLHTINWVSENEIGAFPGKYNHLVGYDNPNPDAKIIHYTQGMPAYPELSDCEHANAWAKEHGLMNSIRNWEELMGNSIHATTIDGKRVPKYKEGLIAKQATCG